MANRRRRDFMLKVVASRNDITELAPLLVPGDVVILDNLAAHKSERAETNIRAKGACIPLPATLQP